MSETERPLRVGIDARLVSGQRGGVEQVVIGLAKGLADLAEEGAEEYIFLAYEGHTDWIAPYLSHPKLRLLQVPAPPQRVAAAADPAWKASLKRALPWLERVHGRLLQSLRSPDPLPVSDGVAEAAGIEVMHFVTQTAFLTSIPSIYHPHDLQHLHLPQFFAPGTVAWRERTYRAFCQQARRVAVGTTWTKQDVMQHYSLAEEKMAVVALAPVTAFYQAPDASEVSREKDRLKLPDAFAFYPAQTWPHKNHEALLRAQARLRDEGILVPLVFSGKIVEPEHERLVRLADRLGTGSHIRFLGFVSPLQLRCLYALARASIIPTRFEAASFPLWEAFQAGVPAACSTVTSLPAQAGDAALLFDPNDVPAIAEAMKKLWLDDEVRAGLIAKGRRRVEVFTWQRTARHFRALYRQIANRSLTSEDCALLEADPLL